MNFGQFLKCLSQKIKSRRNELNGRQTPPVVKENNLTHAPFSLNLNAINGFHGSCHKLIFQAV